MSDGNPNERADDGFTTSERRRFSEATNERPTLFNTI